MTDIKLHETASEILLRQLINKKYPNYLSTIITSDTEKSSVKNVLKELTEVLKWEKNCKEIVIDQDVFYEGLVNEIYAYYHKAFLQKKNIDFMIQNIDYEFTWMYVTQYYYLFFIACTLGRMNNYFVIYLDQHIAEKISEVATIHQDQLSQINGSATYFLKIEKYDEQDAKLKIIITSTRDQHKSTWQSVKKFIGDYKPLCSNQDIGLEKQIIENINQLFKRNNFIFSESRNYYNYRFEPAYDNSNYKLIPNEYYNNKEKMWKYLIDLDVQSIDIKNSSKILVCISEYLFSLIDKLMNRITD